MPKNAEFDVIIFGATGYTGKVVVTEFVKLNRTNMKWAVAGRNAQKLREMLQSVSDKVGQDISSMSTVIARCEDEESIVAMARKARVIINCCGPYRFYGEVVVKSCVENGTHHVDVCGEPEYLENMQNRYNDIAEKNGAYIVGACSFDSVPADFGVIHLTKNFPGVVNSIESWFSASTNLRMGPTVNYATWESLVHSLANSKNLVKVRQKFLSMTNRPKSLRPTLKSRSLVHRAKVCNNEYGVPFYNSNKSVVFRSQTFFYDKYKQRPVQYIPYFICQNLIFLLGYLFMGAMLVVLSKISLGRRVLLRYPEIFTVGVISRKGPSEKARLHSTGTFRFVGSGWTRDIADRYEDKTQIDVPPNKTIQTEVFLKDFSYGFTARSVITSAVTILNESDKMPSTGGVYTPGGAFLKTNFLDKLIENSGISFKVVPKDA